ncbi:MAG: hypothetical protein PVS3B1_27510 [Ktedonobacteraceae bacterium]
MLLKSWPATLVLADALLGPAMATNSSTIEHREPEASTRPEQIVEMMDITNKYVSRLGLAGCQLYW